MVDFTKRKTSQLAITVLFILSIVLGSSTIKAQCKPGYTHVGTWSKREKLGAQTVEFSKEIPACGHDSLAIELELDLSLTWDGVGNYCCGPDIFQIWLDDTLMFQTTFSNTGNLQSYPSQYPGGPEDWHKPRTGCIAQSDITSRYLLKFNVPHSDPTMTVKVTQVAFQGIFDEYWKINRLSICAHTHEPKIRRTQSIEMCKGDTVEFRGRRFSQSGTYVVTVSNACVDSVFTLHVRENELPNASMAGPVRVCQFDTSQFVEIQGLKPHQLYGYLYRVNQGPVQTIRGDTGNRAFIQIPSLSAGSQVIRLIRVEDQLGLQCARNVNDSVVVQVESAPKLVPLRDTLYCQFERGGVFEFQAYDSKAPYECWLSYNGSDSQRLLSDATGKFSIPISTDDPGRQAFAFLKLTDNSDMRCSHQLLDTGYAIVAPLPSASIKDDVVSCPKDSSVIVEFSGWGYQSPYTFYYQVTEGAMQTLVSDAFDKARIDVSLSQSGLSQIALLKVVDGSPKHCASDRDDRIEIEVLNGPIAKFKYSPNWVFESTEWVDFYSACEGKGLSYLWFCDDQPFGDGENARKQLGEIGSYRIKLTVTDSNGCIGEEEVVVQVSEDFKVFIPNAFTPNGNDLNEGFYPVCSGLHAIEWIKIYNRWGEQIYASVQPWNGRYHGGLVPEGVYIYEICVSDVQSTKYNFEGSLHVMR